MTTYQNTPSLKTILGTRQVYVKFENRLKTIHQYLNHKYQNQRGEWVDLIKKPLKVSYSTQFHKNALFKCLSSLSP